jgi:hypothetical protein
MGRLGMEFPELGRLNDDEFRALRDLSLCVLAHESDYCISGRTESATRMSLTIKPSTANPKRHYSVTFANGMEPLIKGPMSCRSDLDRRLSPLGYTEGCSDFSHQTFRFSSRWLERFREVYRPSNDDVMRFIGYELFRAWLDDPQPLKRRFHIDVEPFCQRRNVSPKQFSAQTKFMVGRGLARFSGHAENHVHEGYLWLQQPGVEWAASGFSSSSAVERTEIELKVEVDVRVQLHITIQATIEQIQHSDEIPDELKERFIAALDKLEEEPSYESVQEVLAFGVDTVAAGQYTLMFLPFLLNLFAAGGEFLAKLLPFHPFAPR